MTEDSMKLQKLLPVGAAGRRSSGWWGVSMLIVTEASLFAYLLLSYYYLWAQTEQPWPPEGLPRLLLPGLNTIILLSSSLCVYRAEKAMRGNRRGFAIFWMAIAILAGAVFVGIQCNEWHGKSYGLATSLYGSLYFTITGFHMLHVVVGLVILTFLLVWIALGYFDARRYEALKIGGIYWHFVDAVWVFVFTSFYLVPYLR